MLLIEQRGIPDDGVFGIARFRTASPTSSSMFRQTAGRCEPGTKSVDLYVTGGSWYTQGSCVQLHQCTMRKMKDALFQI